MYRPESGIAEEFIDDQEIKDTLAYADANKNNKELILSIIEKAKKLTGWVWPASDAMALFQLE